MQTHDAIVVGAGPAGLAAAAGLVRRGVEPLVVEAADRIGGRLVTDEVDGYLLDRGFQVLNTSYPALHRHVSLEALKLRPLPAAASVFWEGKQVAFGSPLQSPRLLPSTLAAAFATTADLARLGFAILRLLPSNLAALDYSKEDSPALDWLLEIGLGRPFIDAFFRPFFGGVLLDLDLASSARCLRYDLRQFVIGQAALPERGMRAIPEMMAERLGRRRVRINSPVAELLRGESGQIQGVRLADGSELATSTVIVATEALEAARLTGLPLPTAGRGEVCVHLAVDRPVLPGGRILLDPRPNAPFANLVEPSASAPSYAPVGSSLVMLIAVGPAGDGQDWEGAALDALHGHFPGLPRAAARVLRVDRIPFAVLEQPPGLHATLDRWVNPAPGLFLAGEETVAASLNGALLAGERAARAAAVTSG